MLGAGHKLTFILLSQCTSNVHQIQKSAINLNFFVINVQCVIYISCIKYEFNH